MKRLTKKEVKSLLTVDTPPCVSIYVPLGDAESESDLTVVYKRLLCIAQDFLLKSYSPGVTNRILAPLQTLALGDFLAVPGGTLVLFKSPTIEGYVLVPKPLPGLAVVSNSFHLKPLFEFLVPYEEFYLLSLDRERVRLFRGDALSFEVHREFCIDEEASEKVISKPTPPAGTVWGALNRLLLRVGFSPSATPNRARFYSRVDQHVTAMLQGTRAPLLLAGSRSDAHLYRSVSTYRMTARPRLPWRIENSDSENLRSAHEAASSIAARHFGRSHKEALRDLREAAQAKLVRLDVEGVANALALGHAKTVYFRREEMSWGTIDWSTGRVQRSPYQRDGRDDDLIDDCIEQAISQGCRIVALEKHELPEFGSIAAILNPERPPEPLHAAKTVVKVSPRRFAIEDSAGNFNLGAEGM